MVNTILTYKLVSNRFFLRKQSHFFVSVEIIVILFWRLIVESSHLSPLSQENRKEFGALLLLDQLMCYELLLQEKEDLDEIVNKLEKKVAELKKGFFHSEEQDQDLNFEKSELSEAKEALSQVEKEMS